MNTSVTKNNAALIYILCDTKKEFESSKETKKEKFFRKMLEHLQYKEIKFFRGLPNGRYRFFVCDVIKMELAWKILRASGKVNNVTFFFDELFLRREREHFEFAYKNLEFEGKVKDTEENLSRNIVKI